ncbi:MAG: methyl-accepting chemotaxis protein [Nitrospirae bacterium]|nr:MAG: methyl-accepting chemotaxis protein [Nitrospirota bacterium]
MEEYSPKRRPPFWKRRFYVHELQKTLAIWLGLALVSYSLLVFAVAFLIPFILPAIEGLPSVSVVEQAATALQVFALATTIWPALLFIVPVTACCSIFVTHRLMGPLGRIEGAAKELIRGNLDLRIRLRKGDDLQALAGFMNEAVDNLVQAIRVIKESETSVREILSGLVDEVQKRPSGNGEMLNRLNKALKDSQRIEQVLQKFQFSTPSR